MSNGEVMKSLSDYIGKLQAERDRLASEMFDLDKEIKASPDITPKVRMLMNRHCELKGQREGIIFALRLI